MKFASTSPAVRKVFAKKQPDDVEKKKKDRGEGTLVQSPYLSRPRTGQASRRPRKYRKKTKEKAATLVAIL